MTRGKELYRSGDRCLCRVGHKISGAVRVSISGIDLDQFRLVALVTTSWQSTEWLKEEERRRCAADAVAQARRLHIRNGSRTTATASSNDADAAGAVAAQA